MENVIGAFCAPLQEIHGFFRWEDDQFNFAPLSLTSDPIHDRQCSAARADHQAAAFPRYLLVQRERRVTETVPKLLGGFLLAPANFPPVDHDVVGVLNAVDLNSPKGELLERHGRPPMKDTPGLHASLSALQDKSEGYPCTHGRRDVVVAGTAQGAGRGPPTCHEPKDGCWG